MSVVSKFVWEEFRKARKETQEIARAAWTNENITRKRVERVEDVLWRGFWGRIKWLVLGK